MNSHSAQKSKLKQQQAAKSPSKNLLASSPSKLYQNSKYEAEGLRMFQVPQLTKLMDSFHKEIENPIDAINAIYQAKAPQRCFQHNNIITLYCPNDRLPLCVTCMYQNSQHKKHKVMPINRATQSLKQETHSRLNKVALQLENMNSMLIKTHSHLKKVERDFPDLITRVERFYLQLHEMLVKKKQEQVQHIRQTWGRMRYQYSTLANQLQKINIFVREKVTAIHNRAGQENILFNRNIANYLARLPEILSPDLCNYRETRYEIELSRFQNIKNTVNKGLVFTSPFEQVISRNSSRKKFQSTSKDRTSLSPAPKSASKRQITEESKELYRSRLTPTRSSNKDRSLSNQKSFRKR